MWSKRIKEFFVFILAIPCSLFILFAMVLAKIIEIIMGDDEM